MKLEVLPARKGDCLLLHCGTRADPGLVLIDGGPAGVYKESLRPRLMELRAERQIPDNEPLVIDLVVVSHVDDDHINGILRMFEEMDKLERGDDPPLFEVSRLWHNSFDDILGNDEVRLGGEPAQFGTASAAADFAALVEGAECQAERDVALILAGVAQGDQLRALADKLGIALNPDFGFKLIQRAKPAKVIDIKGMKLTVIGPDSVELAKLQADFDEWLKKQPGRATPAAALAALTDESVANLSSIVLLASEGKQTILLTGDARSDFVHAGLKALALPAPGDQLTVLKMPHHGSDRNVDEAFLRAVPARHYVFSGDGEHGNPERGTIEMLLKAQPGAKIDLLFTYPIATIDAERRNEHEDERRKEERRTNPRKLARKPWSDAEHGLATALKGLPAKVKVVASTGGPLTITP